MLWKYCKCNTYKKKSNTHNISQYFSQRWQIFTNSYLDYLFRINLVPQLFSQFCHNFAMWQLVSGGIMDTHEPTILFSLFTTCHIENCGKSSRNCCDTKLTHLFTYHYQSVTSINVKTFVKFVISIDFLKKIHN